MKPELNEKPLTEAEEIEAMLPWLVTGTLDRAETARVSRYLEAHPEAAAHVALARDEQDAAIGGNEMISGPGNAALDRLMATIAATPQARQFNVPSPASVWEKFASLITGLGPKTMGFAAAAAAFVLIAQAATIGILATREAGPGYQTASGGPVAQTGEAVFALVALQPGVTAAALTSTLSELKAAIVDGPKAGGVYRVRLAVDKSEAATALDRLKVRTNVFAFVGPASP